MHERKVVTALKQFLEGSVSMVSIQGSLNAFKTAESKSESTKEINTFFLFLHFFLYLKAFVYYGWKCFGVFLSLSTAWVHQRHKSAVTVPTTVICSELLRFSTFKMLVLGMDPHAPAPALARGRCVYGIDWIDTTASVFTLMKEHAGCSGPHWCIFNMAQTFCNIGDNWSTQGSKQEILQDLYSQYFPIKNLGVLGIMEPCCHQLCHLFSSLQRLLLLSKRTFLMEISEDSGF